MGFFTRTAMDMLMKTTHPEINRRQCWNLHPHRKPCTECKDICPPLCFEACLMFICFTSALTLHLKDT